MLVRAGHGILGPNEIRGERTSMNETVLYDSDAGIATLTFNRP